MAHNLPIFISLFTFMCAKTVVYRQIEGEPCIARSAALLCLHRRSNHSTDLAIVFMCGAVQWIFSVLIHASSFPA